jgi:hypothetical protein
VVRHRLLGAAAALALFVATGGVGSVVVAAPADAAAAPTGQVYVVHGIAGLRLEFYVDNRSVCDTEMTKTIVGPLTLSAGTHTMSMRQGKTVVSQRTFTVAAGSSTDLVAHRFADASRAPTLTAFRNDLSAVPPGKARLLIAHTAAVPPADVLVNGEALVRDMANGESSTSLVPGGSYTVSLVPTATTGPAIFGPTTLPVRAGTLTSIFAIGDAAAGTMDAVVQYLDVPVVGAQAPRAVNTGDGGQAAALFSAGTTADGTGRAVRMPAGVLLVGVLLVGVLLAGVLLAVARQRRRDPSRR